MKLCRGCNRTLDESDFTRNSRSPDGFDWRCRDCKARQSQKYIHSEHGRKRRSEYYEKTKEQHFATKRRKRAEYALDNPEKIRARQLIGNAVRRGYMERPENSHTWYNRWEFHHPDHSRPYFGVFVSPSEHRLIDEGKATCPECHDYSEQVKQRLLADWGLK